MFHLLQKSSCFIFHSIEFKTKSSFLNLEFKVQNILIESATFSWRQSLVIPCWSDLNQVALIQLIFHILIYRRNESNVFGTFSFLLFLFHSMYDNLICVLYFRPVIVCLLGQVLLWRKSRDWDFYLILIYYFARSPLRWNKDSWKSAVRMIQ